MFHRHEMSVVASGFTPPSGSLKRVTNVSEETLLRLTVGFTTIVYGCARCSKVTVIETPGKVDSAQEAEV